MKSKNGEASELKGIYHSPHNGDIVKDRIYCRVYDFNRDSWKDLVKKLYSPIWRTDERLKYLLTIKNKLAHRISKGSCSQVDVDLFILELEKHKRVSKKIVKKVGKDVSVIKKNTLEGVLECIYKNIKK